MPRKTYRTIKSRSRDQYSTHATGIFLQVDSGATVNQLYQAAHIVVPSTTMQGKRKVKHLTVNLTSDSNANQFYWALVYVPDGYNPNALFTAGTIQSNEMYEPNQNVLNCGVIDPSAGPIRISTPLSRNLNNGDRVYIVIGSTTPAATYQGIVRYAITLQ